MTIDRLPHGMGAPAFSPDGKLAGRPRPHGGSGQGLGCGDRQRGLLLQLHGRRVRVGRGLQPGRQTPGRRGCPRGFASGTWPAARRRPPGRPIPRLAYRPDLQPGRQTPGDGGLRRDGGAVGHRDGSEGPDLQRALRTRLRAGLQSGRHAAGHGRSDGTLRLWDATSRRDSVSVPKDGVFAGEFPSSAPTARLF